MKSGFDGIDLDVLEMQAEAAMREEVFHSEMSADSRASFETIFPSS